MLVDISFFLLVKIFALLGVAIIMVGAPLLVMWVLLVPLAPETPLMIKIWRSAVGTIGLLGIVVYTSWIWPFNEPRSANFNTHPSAAFWNNLIDGFDEHKVRWAKAPPVTRTTQISSLRRFELVSWNPPKHFYVTLKDVETGQRYENIFVSKHCNAHGQLKRGDQYNLTITYYSLSNRPDQAFYEFSNLYSAFCGS